jgi:CheY-like chemotaxis protein
MTTEEYSHQARIIIVDDDRGTRESLETILEDNCDVISVEDGRKALTKVKEEAFDLVLLDLVMPGMDGIETLTSNPVLMITSPNRSIPRIS